MEILVFVSGLFCLAAMVGIAAFGYHLINEKELSLRTRVDRFFAVAFGVFAIVGFVYFISSFIQLSESDCGMPLGASCQAQFLLNEIKEKRINFMLASVLSLVLFVIQIKFNKPFSK